MLNLRQKNNMSFKISFASSNVKRMSEKVPWDLPVTMNI